MRMSEEREDPFREEKQYLDEPIIPPTRKVQGPKEKKPHDEPVATVFFRPPKGIKSSAATAQQFFVALSQSHRARFSLASRWLSPKTTRISPLQVLEFLPKQAAGYMPPRLAVRHL